MIKSFEEFESRIISKLESNGLIEKFSSVEVKPSPNLNLIIKLFERPSKILMDDQGIYYKDENGDKVYCPEMHVSISEKGEWLSDQIPNVEFDIDQSGNVRKADESEALFCLINISRILKEQVFKEELKEVSKKYDFKNMKSIKDGDKTFRDLLNEWQEMQSVIINIIVSACKYRISDYKKDIEKYLKDGISGLEATELRDLETQIRSINFEYSGGALSPSEIKKLDRIERLKIINERDDKISSLIINSKAGVLYKVLNLSTEYISPVKKKKILISVNKEVDSLLDDPNFSNMKEDRTQLISNLSRRALRFERTSIRRQNVEKYLKDKENFKLPSKQ